LSTKIVKNNNLIAVEDLSVRKMLKSKKLAPKIAKTAWRKFLIMLEYKSKWNDRFFVKVDPSGTSSTCSFCGYKKYKLQLNERIIKCDNCKKTYDRDYNASINILKRGCKILNRVMPVVDGWYFKKKC